jgi:hypothetical protein
MNNIVDIQQGLNMLLGGLDGIVDTLKDKMTDEQKKMFEEKLGDLSVAKKDIDKAFKDLNNTFKDGSFDNFGKV